MPKGGGRGASGGKGGGGGGSSGSESRNVRPGEDMGV